ncbi:11074_t:CDS:2 [Funneliformis mosseae]|uniref:11074_t:CDS:1 n=1 Tax=Funneliformis mosseae TaxID=27381 RepID=A0A9N8YT00_FUNMO|nr:11074_t:CDS:2 [Funneliformis mosseae]
MISQYENQLLRSFILKERGSNALKELENRKKEIQNLNIDLKINKEELSNISSQSKYEETIQEREKEIKNKLEIISNLEEKIREQEKIIEELIKEQETKQEIINILKETIKEQEDEPFFDLVAGVITLSSSE